MRSSQLRTVNDAKRSESAFECIVVDGVHAMMQLALSSGSGVGFVAFEFEVKASERERERERLERKESQWRAFKKVKEVNGAVVLLLFFPSTQLATLSLIHS